MSKSIEKQIVQGIIADLNDRKGISDVFDEIDHETWKEMLADLEDVVSKVLDA